MALVPVASALPVHTVTVAVVSLPPVAAVSLLAMALLAALHSAVHQISTNNILIKYITLVPYSTSHWYLQFIRSVLSSMLAVRHISICNTSGQYLHYIRLHQQYISCTLAQYLQY
jgi:hypothetical protein